MHPPTFKNRTSKILQRSWLINLLFLAIRSTPTSPPEHHAPKPSELPTYAAFIIDAKMIKISYNIKEQNQEG